MKDTEGSKTMEKSTMTVNIRQASGSAQYIVDVIETKAWGSNSSKSVARVNRKKQAIWEAIAYPHSVGAELTKLTYNDKPLTRAELTRALTFEAYGILRMEEQLDEFLAIAHKLAKG